MIFSYFRYAIEPTRTIPAGEIYRPMIPIRIIGPKASINVLGLLDTGADNVFLSASLAEVLGVELALVTEAAVGAGSHAIDTWPASVSLEVSDGQDTFRWPAEVGFLSGDDDPPVAFLGNAGFLEHFNAVFDTERWQVELLPHEALQTSD